MRAYSVGLETEVELDGSEIQKLKNSTIEGILKFREVMDEHYKRQIPIRIIHDEFQREFLEVISIPSGCYFGDANLIIFMINQQFYQKLLCLGSYSDRFFTSGKLSLFTENIK